MDIAQLLLASAIWGTAPAILRVSVPVFGVAWTAELRLIFAGTAGLFVLWLWREALELRRHWRFFAILGFANVGFPYLLFGIALREMSASLVGAFNAITPVLVALWLSLVRGQSRSPVGWLGLALGIGGTLLLTGSALFEASATLTGVACSFFAVCSVAAAAVYMADNAQGVGARRTMAGSLAAAAVIFAPGLVLAPMPDWPGWWPVLLVVMLGTLCTVGPYLLYFRLIESAGPSFAVLTNYLVPAFSVVWGAALLRETISLRALVAIGVIFLGVWLARERRAG